MSCGYMGKTLRIDLSKQTWDAVELDSAIRDKFLGGRGLAIWLLSKETRGNIDPFGDV